MSKKIKKYEEFVNEEINLKKALAGAALGAGLAFGSPQQASAQQTVKTEVTQSVSDDYSEVIHVDSTMKKADIKSIVSSQLGKISGVRIVTSTQDKIVCSVTFTSKPDKSSGMAYGNLEISFKDGRYKVDFFNIYFDYMGQQPQSATQQVGQTLGRQIGGLATQVVTSQVRNPILQSGVRQAAGAITRGTMNTQQSQVEKPNMTYQQAQSESPEFVTSINSEISKIIETVKSGFSGKQVEEDW